MVDKSGLYTRLATRDGFNASVRHINKTLDILGSCNPKRNIADEVNSLLSSKEMEEDAVLASINMVLVDKYNYVVVTRNIDGIAQNIDAVVKEVASWNAVDLVVGYHHPDLGFIVINPKNPDSIPVISGFRKNELCVIYAGDPASSSSRKELCMQAATSLADLVEGKKTKSIASLANGPYVWKAPPKTREPKNPRKAKKGGAKKKATALSASPTPAVSSAPAAAAPIPPPAPQIAPGRSKMSSLISVVVSNELFHNGNVEAWKRIIRSYNARYPNLQVFIYYDGERIVDINTLFKWGKVKHGSCIQFCVAGEDIQDLAKLSRYFRQGASPQFEAFLRGSPDTVMNLF